MGTNCSNGNTSSKHITQQVLMNIHAEIQKLRDEQQFNTALIKMAKLIELLKKNGNQKNNNNYLEIMQLYIEMARINQEISGNHDNACKLFRNAKAISIILYNGPNEVITKVIDPLLDLSLKAIEDKQVAQNLTRSSQRSQDLHTKEWYLQQQKEQLQSSFRTSSPSQREKLRKSSQRSSTRTTSRFSCLHQSLNIIEEEEHSVYGENNNLYEIVKFPNQNQDNIEFDGFYQELDFEENPCIFSQSQTPFDDKPASMIPKTRPVSQHQSFTLREMTNSKK